MSDGGLNEGGKIHVGFGLGGAYTTRVAPFVRAGTVSSNCVSRPQIPLCPCTPRKRLFHSSQGLQHKRNAMYSK